MKTRFVALLLFAVVIVFTAACVEKIPDARTALVECQNGSTDPECSTLCEDYPDALDCIAADAGTDLSLCDGACQGEEEQEELEEPACDGGCQEDLVEQSCEEDGTCVTCLAAADCTDGVCFVAASAADNACVACLGDDDCTDGVCIEGASPADNACVACLSDDDCSDGVCIEGASPADNACVTCLSDDDCTDGVCIEGASPADNACVTCLSDDDCSDGVCFQAASPAANECVDCVDSSDCTDPYSARCAEGATPAANICADCDDSTQCAGLVGNEVCDIATGECGPAPGGCTDDSDCAMGGTVFACDLRDNTCSNIEAGTAGSCQTCVSSTSCTPGNHCVALTYQGVARGYYCMPRFQPPSMKCDGPYGSSPVTRQTLGAGTKQVCLINEQLTTCEAIAQFEDSCPNGDECTADGSSCESFDGSPRCTYACSGDLDCSGGSECDDDDGGDFCGL